MANLVGKYRTDNGTLAWIFKTVGYILYMTCPSETNAFTGECYDGLYTMKDEISDGQSAYECITKTETWQKIQKMKRLVSKLAKVDDIGSMYEAVVRNKEEAKNVRELTFKDYRFKYSEREKGERYAIALFSDAHIEETVKPESVMGKNEYSVPIAEARIQKYFENLAACLNADEVDDLIFASLGDTISAYIHDELAQCNGLSPLKAVAKAQSLIVSGLKLLCSGTDVKTIKFVGIVGNHSRTTKKIQHANGYEMSYEWLMYQNIKDQCEALGLPIEFAIPESEIAIVEAPDGRRLLFCHGFQIRTTSNSVCGIYPALNRLALKWAKVFQQDRIYLGHFHSCTSINSAAVNGSIIGYNSFALTNGFEYQEPCQYYEVVDSNIGQLLERKIYCK